jgi:hypothetical protein
MSQIGFPVKETEVCGSSTWRCKSRNVFGSAHESVDTVVEEAGESTGEKPKGYKERMKSPYQET